MTAEATIPFSGAISIATDGAAIWVLGAGGTISRIDPATDAVAVSATLAPASDAYQAIAVGPSSAWVTDWDAGGLIRLDSATLEASPAIPIGGAPKGVLVDAAGVWVALTHGGAVVRVDPQRNAIVATIPAGAADVSGPNWLASVQGRVWTGVPNTSSVYEIDESANRVSVRTDIPRPAVPCGGLAVTSTDVWVTSCDNAPVLARVSRSTGAVSTLTLAGRAYSLLVVDDRPWLSVERGVGRPGTIQRIDAATGSVDRVLAFDEAFAGGGDMVIASGSVWVVDLRSSRILRLPLSTFAAT